MILITLCLIALILWFLQRRNDQVYEYRARLLESLWLPVKVDKKVNRDHLWRYEAFESVTHDEMVFKFWKPLDSFYPDRSFTDGLMGGPDTRKKTKIEVTEPASND